jgi:rubrerythrin
MGFFDLFKPAPSISPEEVRDYIKDKKPDEYCLLDVRQPAEYERGHLPGAYCSSGNRSRSATGILMGAGIKTVLNMDGGISRYNGIIAGGPPEAGMFCFPESLTPDELVAVAWFLENGTIQFLDGVQAGEFTSVVKDLITAKRSHKNKFEKLYSDLTGKDPSPDFPRSVLNVPSDDIMVGCVKVSSALTWVKGKGISEVLELLISLEANTYDLYLKLGRSVKADEARRLFHLLSAEEQEYIDQIASAFEKTLKASQEKPA